MQFAKGAGGKSPHAGLLAGLLLAGAVATGSAAEGGPGLIRPLDRPARLTSSFGEYRAGHYHGGLDYSTGGAVGLPVRAPADGWVYRLRVSGVGYGKAVYFRLEDGRTAVFAHLSGFAPPLEAAAAAEQDRLGRYEVDLYPEPGALPVKAGEVLALTGDTGAGPPHLHAELRVDPGANVAVDPRLHGWEVEDRVPPVLGRLRVEPARAGVLVNGGIDPVILGSASDTLFIDGPVRCWIEVHDRASSDSGVLAPGRLEAGLDGAPWATVNWERFDWRWPAEVEWTFLEPAARTGGERWVRLDPPPGSRQPIHGTPGGVARLGEMLSPHDHELRIVATDPAGNRSETAFPIRGMEMGARGSRGSRLPEGGPRAPRAVSHGPFLEVLGIEAGEDDSPRLRFVGAEGESTEVAAYAVPPAGAGRFTTDGPDPGRSAVWRVDLGERLSAPLARLGARTVGDVPAETTLPLEGITLVVGRGAVYEDLWVAPVRGQGLADPGEREPELDPVAPSIRLTPWAEPLREAIQVVLPIPPGVSREGLGIYSRSGGGWAYEGADPVEGGLATRIRNLEELALFRDRVPPMVTFVVQGDGATEPPRPRLTAKIVESGSGVTWRTLTMKLDGEEVIAEWDPEGRNFTAVLREPLPPGEHRLEVIALDRAGNRSELERRFRVPGE